MTMGKIENASDMRSVSESRSYRDSTRSRRLLLLVDEMGGGTGEHIVSLISCWQGSGWDVRVVSPSADDPDSAGCAGELFSAQKVAQTVSVYTNTKDAVAAALHSGVQAGCRTHLLLLVDHLRASLEAVGEGSHACRKPGRSGVQLGNARVRVVAGNPRNPG